MLVPTKATGQALFKLVSLPEGGTPKMGSVLEGATPMMGVAAESSALLKVDNNLVVWEDTLTFVGTVLDLTGNAGLRSLIALPKQT